MDKAEYGSPGEKFNFSTKQQWNQVCPIENMRIRRIYQNGIRCTYKMVHILNCIHLLAITEHYSTSSTEAEHF